MLHRLVVRQTAGHSYYSMGIQLVSFCLCGMIYSIYGKEWNERWGLGAKISGLRGEFRFHWLTEFVEIWSDSGNCSNGWMSLLRPFVDTVVRELWQLFCGHPPLQHCPPLRLLLPAGNIRYQTLIDNYFSDSPYFRATNAFTYYFPPCSVVRTPIIGEHVAQESMLFVCHQIVHELTHQFFHVVKFCRIPVYSVREKCSIFGVLPIWLNEGLAEFCAEFIYRPNAHPPSVRFGHLLIPPGSGFLNDLSLRSLVSWNDYMNNTNEKFHRSASFVRCISETWPNLWHNLRRWAAGFGSIPQCVFDLMMLEMNGTIPTWSDSCEQTWYNHATKELGSVTNQVLARRIQHHVALRGLYFPPSYK